MWTASQILYALSKIKLDFMLYSTFPLSIEAVRILNEVRRIFRPHPPSTMPSLGRTEILAATGKS